MADDEILPFLLTLPRATFFTHDLGLAERTFCHAKYCLVVLAVGQYEAAHFVRRLLRHPAFNSKAKRMGAVIRAMPTGLVVWRRRADEEVRVDWPD